MKSNQNEYENLGGGSVNKINPAGDIWSQKEPRKENQIKI